MGLVFRVLERIFKELGLISSEVQVRSFFDPLVKWIKNVIIIFLFLIALFRGYNLKFCLKKIIYYNITFYYIRLLNQISYM